MELLRFPYFCLLVFIKRCYSTCNALCLIDFASLNCLLSFVLFVDAFGPSLVELESSLYITVRISGPNVLAALLVFHKESF